MEKKTAYLIFPFLSHHKMCHYGEFNYLNIFIIVRKMSDKALMKRRGWREGGWKNTGNRRNC